MSEKVVSEKERLWNWMMNFQIDSKSIENSNSEFYTSDPTLSDIDFKNKMVLVWTTHTTQVYLCWLFYFRPVANFLTVPVPSPQSTWPKETCHKWMHLLLLLHSCWSFMLSHGNSCKLGHHPKWKPLNSFYCPILELRLLIYYNPYFVRAERIP